MADFRPQLYWVKVRCVKLTRMESENLRLTVSYPDAVIAISTSSRIMRILHLDVNNRRGNGAHDATATDYAAGRIA